MGRDGLRRDRRGRRLLAAALVALVAALAIVAAAGDAARPPRKVPAPTNLTATAGDAQVTLNWSGSGANKVGGYRVYRRQPDGTWPTAPIASTAATTTTYVDRGLTNGTTYTYRVTAVSASPPTVESAPSNTASATPTAASAGACGTATTPPATYQHVVWVVMENKSYSEIIGSGSAPYLNQLARQCGVASNFFAETHPSLPNYIAMTSGSTQGITDDNGPSSHPLGVPSIFSQLGTGGAWRSLQESMPSNCYLSNSGSYAVRHNPATYYTNIRSDCSLYDVPLGATPDISARFTFVTPNLCNDMHDCSVATGDSWLSSFVPKLFASSEYQAGATAVFITWDEDDSSASNHIATIVASPTTTPGTVSSTSFNHYSMLRTTEEMLGLSALGNAGSATSMRSAFGL
jgi:phosphatidylinositol-3-phosphatase